MIRVMAKRSVIYLYRNDLRVHDNECLKWAHDNGDYVLPVYCFDPENYKKTWHYGFPKTGKFRAQFLIDCVNDLRQNLEKKGSGLIVKFAEPNTVIRELAKHLQSIAPVSHLVYQNELTKEELDVEKSLKDVCKEFDISTKEFWGLTLFHKDDIPYENCQVPDVYSAFRMKTENRSHVRPLIDNPAKFKPLPNLSNYEIGTVPSLADLGLENIQGHSSSAFPFTGGESTGINRVNEYFWDTNHVLRYKETRNGLIGESYSTKFSPWLASGSLSPRYIYHKLKEFEKAKRKNDSTYWVIFELMWRDYFKFVTVKYGDKIFYPGGIKSKKLDWKYDKGLVEKWCLGQTGVPFVDANMREMLETGWMSNRGRQNVASFLVRDLQLDWRYGAEWFESLLLDHDVSSNYGNWNYAAGIGNDPRGAYRKFNMIKQGLDYDSTGEYIRTWVPELSEIPDEKVHVPWVFHPDVNYPKPIHIDTSWEKYYPKSSKKTVTPGKRKRGVDFYFKSGQTSK